MNTNPLQECQAAVETRRNAILCPVTPIHLLTKDKIVQLYEYQTEHNGLILTQWRPPPFPATPGCLEVLQGTQLYAGRERFQFRDRFTLVGTIQRFRNGKWRPNWRRSSKPSTLDSLLWPLPLKPSDPLEALAPTLEGLLAAFREESGSPPIAYLREGLTTNGKKPLFLKAKMSHRGYQKTY